MAKHGVRYLVFDVESVADGALVAKVRYPGEEIAPADAVARYRAELLEKYGNDFIPYTFQVPVSVVVAKLDESFHLLDLVAIDEPSFRSHILTEHFWRGWESYGRPTLISFNGRTFDIPLLELAAFRYGIPLAGWFNLAGKQYEQPRHRYNNETHLDLHDVLTNYGASRFTGGLNLAANLLGKPGKMDVQGHMVQDLFNEGRLAEINDYCRCDVLDTYFVLLRTAVLLGWLKLDQEQAVVESAKDWLEAKAGQSPCLGKYLAEWGSWVNPWKEQSAADMPAIPPSVGSESSR